MYALTSQKRVSLFQEDASKYYEGNYQASYAIFRDKHLKLTLYWKNMQKQTKFGMIIS